MIDYLLILTCGWVGGVVSTLLIRHAIDGRRPLDPALLPTSVPMPRAAQLALPPLPVSPYAPKKVLPSAPRWGVLKHDQFPGVVQKTGLGPTGSGEDGGRVPRAQEAKPGAGAVAVSPHPAGPSHSVRLLPAIRWGERRHDGEGVTLTGSSGPKPSAALSGHGAQAPRRRS